MRTLASTFSTRNEAEAAARRLEGIGIAPERILLKEVAPPAGAPPGAGAGGVFLSVKVPTHQVEAVNEIMKGEWSDDEASAPAVAPPGAERIEAAGAPESSFRSAPPLPPSMAQPERPAAGPTTHPGSAARMPDPEPTRPAIPPQPARAQATAAGGDRERLRHYLLLYCVALVAAFLLGAGLGLIN